MSALAPIDRDESYQRDYIPLPGGWEIQTKGRGSSFRICDTKDGERWLVADEYLHAILERMAREVRAAYESRPPAPSGGEVSDAIAALEVAAMGVVLAQPGGKRDAEKELLDARAALTAALSTKPGK